MAISLREACGCIGLSGNISIINDFFRYTSVPPSFSGAPGIEKLSLLQQVKLVKYGFHIRLHIKIAVPPGSTFSPTIDQQLSAMRQVYASIGIAIVIRSVETLNLPSSFFDIFVDSCTSASVEMINLFKNLNNVPTWIQPWEYDEPVNVKHKIQFIYSNEIVVYFVSTVSSIPDPLTGNNGILNGCSAYPKGAVIETTVEQPQWGLFIKKEKRLTIPGTIIAGNNASIWTLAHEIGHVLGLDHTEEVNLGSCPKISNPSLCQPNSLMTCCSTNTITNPPPDLSSSEVAAVIETAIKQNYFKKCGDP